MNIVYIHSHDTGRYVSPYGHAVRTPSIQRLAEGGVLFRHAFCACPTCSPSRGALLTGRYPHNNGMVGLAHLGFALNDPREHLSHRLGERGYHTILAGHQHETPHDQVDLLGYDEVIEGESFHAADVAPLAAKRLADAPAEPFFMSVGFIEAHRGFPEADEADDERYVRVPGPIPDTPRTRRDTARFHTAVARFDDGVGQVLAALDQSGLADRTLVICTTDHGIAFPDMKCNLTVHGTGVMLLLRGPAGSALRGGKVVDALTSHVDVLPTLWNLLGWEQPDEFEGVSLLPAVCGEVEQVNEQIYGDLTYHAAYEPQRSVRTPRYSYIRRFDGRDRRVLPNCDSSPSRNLWLEGGWRDRPIAEEMLFDTLVDPGERVNLAADPARADELKNLRGRLLDWMGRTEDPLLDGDYPLPDGAKVVDPDAYDARGRMSR